MHFKSGMGLLQTWRYNVEGDKTFFFFLRSLYSFQLMFLFNYQLISNDLK